MKRKRTPDFRMRYEMQPAAPGKYSRQLAVLYPLTRNAKTWAQPRMSWLGKPRADGGIVMDRRFASPTISAIEHVKLTCEDKLK